MIFLPKVPPRTCLKSCNFEKKDHFSYRIFLSDENITFLRSKSDLDLESLNSLDLIYIFGDSVLRSRVLKTRLPRTMSHTRVHRWVRRAVGMRSQPQGAQAVHGGSVEGAVVEVGLMMMIRWQTHVRQAAVRGEAVTAGGRGGLYRVMLRRRSPIVAVRILRRHLGGNTWALRRFRVALRWML